MYNEFEALTSQLHDIRLPEGLRVPTEREKVAATFEELQFAPQKKISIEEQDEDEEPQPADDQDNEPEEEEAPEGVDCEDMQQLSKVLR